MEFKVLKSAGISEMDLGEIVTKGCELLLDAFQFVGISSRNRVPNNGGVLNNYNNRNNKLIQFIYEEKV
jgi:hypothetical protein